MKLTYFVKEGLVERCVLSLQLMDFLVELCLDVGALDLQVLQGVDASLHNLGQTEGAKRNALRLAKYIKYHHEPRATLATLVLQQCASPWPCGFLNYKSAGGKHARWVCRRFQRTFPQKLINQLRAWEPSSGVPEDGKVRAAKRLLVQYLSCKTGLHSIFVYSILIILVFF